MRRSSSVRMRGSGGGERGGLRTGQRRGIRILLGRVRGQ